jgi:hypothetical protein
MITPMRQTLVPLRGYDISTAPCAQTSTTQHAVVPYHLDCPTDGQQRAERFTSSQ